VRKEENDYQYKFSLSSADEKRIETKLNWNRTIIPGNTFTVTRGFGSSLFMMTWDEWELFENMLDSLPIDASEKRILVRYFIASATDTFVDNQWVMMLPMDLIRFAEIKKGAVIRGKAGFAQIISSENAESIDCISGVEELRARLMYQAALIDVGKLKKL
jgi:DNA-binding transcriptional regulator/RsmH inhibitor MraZ